MITVTSNSFALVMLAKKTILPFQSIEVDLDDLTGRELKSLRYLHQVGRITMTEAGRSTLNKAIYDAFDYSLGDTSSSDTPVQSVNGKTGAVVVDATSIGALQIVNLNTEVSKLYPNLDWSVKYTAADKKTITLNTTKITGLAAGTLSTTSTDAVNGTQLNALTTTVNNKADKTAVASTDVIKEGTTNLYYTNARAVASTITASAGTNAAIATGDTILVALAKLQAQIDALKTA